jgi:translation elongation factor EF-Ts
MEITLEKVELVKDRTGVSYKEAKEALEAADGNVVDAIIAIEETINLTTKTKVTDQAKTVVESIKEAIAKGNVTRIRIKKGDDVLLNLPVNAGVIGTVLAPWAAIIGIITAFGTKCVIELVKTDGSVVDISEKATDKFGDVVEKGSDIAGKAKDKGAAVYSSVKEKVGDATGKTKQAAKEKTGDFKDSVDELWEEAKERIKKTGEQSDEAVDEADKPADPEMTE